jgi:putative endonuclease
MPRYYVYILTNRPKGVLYTGVTNDLVRRVFQHRDHEAFGFTSRYGVARLAYFEEHETAIEAIAREKAIKRWKRSWKFKLVESINPGWEDLWGMIAS